MSLEEDLELVKELESRVLRKRRHEPFELEVRSEAEALLLQNVLNKEKVELFREMRDELERHIIECPECYQKGTAPVHWRLYEMYDTGDQIEGNVFRGEIAFECSTCMKTVRGESVVALLDRVDDRFPEIREYVLEKREETAEPRFAGELTEEDIDGYREQDQYERLFPPGVSDLDQWYSDFEKV